MPPVLVILRKPPDELFRKLKRACWSIMRYAGELLAIKVMSNWPESRSIHFVSVAQPLLLIVHVGTAPGTEEMVQEGAREAATQDHFEQRDCRLASFSSRPMVDPFDDDPQLAGGEFN